MSLKLLGRRWRRRRHDEGGYVAILAAMMFVVLFGMAAFTVDVGNWYVTGQQAQRAADAGALAGVSHLPGDKPGAFADAEKWAAANGYVDGQGNVTVTEGVDGKPTRLRVTVSKQVDNVFGGLFGIPKTTISRSSVADYAGPVPLGSPCNEFGDDPEAGSSRSTNCADAGKFWANVGSPKAPKVSGDAFQNGSCGTEDGCVSNVNKDYDTNGYFYTITLAQAVSNLRIEVFDPALISVGDLCDNSQGDNANLAGAAALPTSKTDITDPTTRYAPGKTSPYCTGDIAFSDKMAGYTNQAATKYTVRTAGPNPWDPLSGTVVPSSSCTGAKTYPGYAGDLSKALDNTNAEYSMKPTVGDFNSTNGYVASVFRRWTRICTISSAPAGSYTIQVQTNGVGADDASGHNRFAIRAYSNSQTSAKDSISIAGFNKMAMYANIPDATTKFFLARVPAGSGGQYLNIRLFDVGDSTSPGTITVKPPPDSNVSSFSSCRGFGAVGGTNGTNLSGCSLSVYSTTNNGKWQTISIPIPSGYTCGTTAVSCWVRLEYQYGSGNQPSDTTSWTASIEGDPVRLIE